MSSPALVAQSNRTSSEADIRALALAKVKACNAYRALLARNVANLTDDQLVDLELEIVAARKVMNAAVAAFNKAV